MPMSETSHRSNVLLISVVFQCILCISVHFCAMFCLCAERYFEVTSVGATMPSLDSKPYCSAAAFRHLGDCEELGQVTCSSRNGALITSSGYFSVYRPRPKYQDLAVNTFLQTSSCKPFPVCPVHNHTYVSHHELEEIKVPCQHIAKTGCSLSNLVQDSRAAPDVALPGQSYPVSG